MSTCHTFVPSPLGDLLVVADSRAVVGLYFPGHWYPPADDTTGRLVEVDRHDVLAQASAELGEYFDGRRWSFDVEVRATGSARSERVWDRLRSIPYGSTVTYGEIAAELGDRRWAQLVGQAVGHNPVSIMIPCHRVVGADGSLTGFAGGLDRKRRLLELEEPDEVRMQRLF